MSIIGTGTAFPTHYYSQLELAEALRVRLGTRHHNVERLLAIHQNTQVEGRYLTLPLSDYATLGSFTAANDHYIEAAQLLGEQAICQALQDAQLRPFDIDHIFFVSITGVATPSIDALLANRLGFRPDVKRTPIFGLGCMAGAAGLARAADYVLGFPKQHALLVSVELCSLTLQRQDLSLTNIIASGLFGDGAAAAVVSGKKSEAQIAPPRRGVQIIGSRSVLYPGTEEMMGWKISSDGFQIVLSGEVPKLVQGSLREDVDALLQSFSLQREDLHFFVCHPGGPKIFDAVQMALGLSEKDLAASKAHFRRVGNLSSASVLHILDDLRAKPIAAQPVPGTYGLTLAFGPGLSTELVLLRW